MLTIDTLAKVILNNCKDVSNKKLQKLAYYVYAWYYTIYNCEIVSMNFEALDELKNRFDDLDIIFLESGGDNLAATFSPDLVDFSIYIIDVAQGEKIPRKAGQGMIKSDLFIINKIDLAPYVGADLEVMRKDTLAFRNENSFIFTNLKTDEGINEVINWIKKNCLLEGIS